ncbi:MAG: ribosome silencing factor [Candidatus Didemnitutus sp.]|nr:ribosome silencing factor [Candidatus Didemnitutus sp.]
MKASKPKKAAAPKKPATRKSVKKVAPSAAQKSTKPTRPIKSAKLVKSSKQIHPKVLTKIVEALDSKKAENLQVLYVGDLSSITDYLVLGTANSDPHLRALRVELEKAIDGEKVKILGIDTSKGSGWTVVDAFDVMVHLFTSENRDKYRLELLWKDARVVPLDTLR